MILIPLKNHGIGVTNTSKNWWSLIFKSVACTKFGTAILASNSSASWIINSEPGPEDLKVVVKHSATIKKSFLLGSVS